MHPSTARGSTRSVTSHGAGVGLGDGARAWRGAARTSGHSGHSGRYGSASYTHTAHRRLGVQHHDVAMENEGGAAGLGYINYTYGIAGNVRTLAVASHGTCSLVNSPLGGTRKP